MEFNGYAVFGPLLFGEGDIIHPKTFSKSRAKSIALTGAKSYKDWLELRSQGYKTVKAKITINNEK